MFSMHLLNAIYLILNRGSLIWPLSLYSIDYIAKIYWHRSLPQNAWKWKFLYTDDDSPYSNFSYTPHIIGSIYSHFFWMDTYLDISKITHFKPPCDTIWKENISLKVKNSEQNRVRYWEVWIILIYMIYTIGKLYPKFLQTIKSGKLSFLSKCL